MAGGRPTAYKQEYCKKLIDHMAKGYSFESFGGLTGHGKQTLYRWLDEHQEFRDAKELGENKSRIFWEGLGVDHVVGNNGPGGKTLNASVWIFNMKNRFGWKDKQGEIDLDDLMKELRKLNEADIIEVLPLSEQKKLVSRG